MKKKFALLLVSVLIISACVFSLAACDNADETEEISDFERNHGERYLKTYNYYYTSLYEQDEDGTWHEMYTWWDDDSMYESTDDLKGYDYLINYNDGDFPNEKWNALFLQGKEYVTGLGRSITVNRNDITFGGTLGTYPVEFADMILRGSADLRFILTDEEQESLFFDDSIGVVEIDYNRPTDRSDGSFLMRFNVASVEILGTRYDMAFYYIADLEEGDTDWSW